MIVKREHLLTVLDVCASTERPSGEEAGQEAGQRPLRQPGGAVQEEAAEFQWRERTREEEQMVRLLAPRCGFLWFYRARLIERLTRNFLFFWFFFAFYHKYVCTTFP